MDDDVFPFHQAESPFPAEPVPASLLLDCEIARKEGLAARGNLMTGCRELDEYVLLGGFERGSVVGVSAEEDEGGEEIGLLIGLQTIANLLASKATARAMVVTTLPAAALLPKLRKALVGQLTKAQGVWQNLHAGLQACLERISISRVFDIEGLREVLEELEGTVHVREGESSPQTAQPEKRTEIPNSDDEGGFSSSSGSPSPKPSPHPDNTVGGAKHSKLPDMVLVTHTSTLLNALFTGRDKDTAHNMMLVLASRLRTLTRSPAHNAPLFVFLNTTTSPAVFPQQPPHAYDTTPTTASRDAPQPPSKHLDSTLRSIFASSSSFSARRNKPSFGLVFSQMLDLHLLCTRVPRTRADSAVLLTNHGMNPHSVSYVWVVEVLLDELGVYEKMRDGSSSEWGERRNREQRWTAVDVDEEGRVVNATINIT